MRCRRDEERLTGLQHKKKHTGGIRGDICPGGVQKRILGMQGQNQVCQTPTGDKTGEEREGHKEDSYRVTEARGRLRKMRLLYPSDKGYKKG